MANTNLDCSQGQDFHLDEEGADRKPRKRRRLRVIIPAYPAFNVYSRIARTTTALGPVSVATSVHEMEGWDVEVIDENNYQRFAPRNESGLPDHETLQKLRPADVVGFYGGLSSTIRGYMTWPGSIRNGVCLLLPAASILSKRISGKPFTTELMSL